MEAKVELEKKVNELNEEFNDYFRQCSILDRTAKRELVFIEWSIKEMADIQIGVGVIYNFHEELINKMMETSDKNTALHEEKINKLLAALGVLHEKMKLHIDEGQPATGGFVITDGSPSEMASGRVVLKPKPPSKKGKK